MNTEREMLVGGFQACKVNNTHDILQYTLKLSPSQSDSAVVSIISQYETNTNSTRII
jgi:uncharacterized protein YihD (DUF1040 family)